MDLDYPIFTVYIDVSNMTPQRAEEFIQSTSMNFNGLQHIIIPNSNKTFKVDCIWNGYKYIKNIHNREYLKILELLKTFIDVNNISNINQDKIKLLTRLLKLKVLKNGNLSR